MRTQKPADSEATAFEKEYNKSDRESNRESESERVEEQAMGDGRKGRGQRTMLVTCGRGQGNLITFDKGKLLCN